MHIKKICTKATKNKKSVLVAEKSSDYVKDMKFKCISCREVWG